MRTIIFILGIIILSPTLFSQEKIRFVFYNTENFFDTINNPNKEDEEYLPNSEMKWGTERYFNKLNKIAEVIDSIGKDSPPAIIGFCEVESELALKDLLSYSSLNKRDFSFCITNSPDTRGINVALLYNNKLFKLTQKKEILVSDKKLGEYYTRNILYVVLTDSKGEVFHVFVNHWPSRRGGEKESEAKRIYAAQQLRLRVDSILKKEPKSQIVIMGDFNDHPNDISIKDNVIKKGSQKELINVFEEEHLAGRGTHFYDGEWGVLDQIILSKGIMEKKSWYFPRKKYGAYKANFLLFKNNKTGEIKPNRTFGGTKYYNGYSDHLPVYIELEKN